MTIQQALSPAAALGVNCLLQIIVCRRTGKLLKSVYVGFAGGMVACVLFCGFSTELLPALATYSAFGYCYFHFINLGETARRIRIVKELSEAGETGLSKKDILARYNSGKILHTRFERLISNRQVTEKEGRYYLADKAVLHMARTMLFMKKVILGRASEAL
jgi:hypothetical protein